VEALGVVQDDSGIDISTNKGEMRARWLVGCDGGRSTVRKSAAIGFPGYEGSTGWLIAEVKMRQPPELGFRETSSGRHAMAMLDDDETVGVVLAGQDPGARDDPRLYELADALNRAYGTDFGVHSPTWLSRFSDAARQAATYRNDRIMLAGDAAHIHAPMGGQGANLGIQDAVNLGWKLAQVAAGISPVELLDTYQSERHPIAERVLRNTIAQSALRQPGERTAILGGLVSELLAMEEPRRRFAAMMSGLDIRYDCGEGHPLLGRRMPDLDIETAIGASRVYELLRGAQPLLLNFAKPDTVALYDRDARVNTIDAIGPEACELPVIGRVTVPSAVLVRPDGHVAWVAEQGAERLSTVLQGWFGQ
jgi:3-(3-hydroxy-phenyl)propionate hydroxylase